MPTTEERAEEFERHRLSTEVVLVNGNIGLMGRRPDGRVFPVTGSHIRSY